jgi:hypothetical protein
LPLLAAASAGLMIQIDGFDNIFLNYARYADERRFDTNQH